MQMPKDEGLQLRTEKTIDQRVALKWLMLGP